jgi:hypothetical protein
VFKRTLPEDREKDTTIESSWTRWPVESQQIVLRTEDGMPPRGPEAIGVGEWARVWKLKDIENLYDLGFWDNMKDVVFPRYAFHHPEYIVSSRSSTAGDGSSRYMN